MELNRNLFVVRNDTNLLKLHISIINFILTHNNTVIILRIMIGKKYSLNNISQVKFSTILQIMCIYCIKLLRW